MKREISFLFMVLFSFSIFFILGCGRTFESKITFKGKVYYAWTKTYFNGVSTVTVLNPTNPASDAIVNVVGYDDVAHADSSGSYTLTIKTYRQFLSNNKDLYTIQAMSPRSFSSEKIASDEYTTVYAKPGDTIEVRPLLLYQYTEETKNF